MSHAKLSPSSAVRWMQCPGSVVLSEGIPQRRSAAAARGTVCHAISETILLDGTDPQWFLGQEWPIDDNGVCEAGTPGAIVVKVDESMLDTITSYVASAREYIEGADEWMVEEKLPIGHLTGEDGATGTADLIVLRGRELQVHDLKAGHHEVLAEGNPQLKIYALAALEKYSVVADFDTVLCVIHQPEHGGPKEVRYGVTALADFAADVREAAELTRSDMLLNPSDDTCRFCPARATCPALRELVDDAIATEFDALPEDRLGDAMAKVNLVEAWCTAVRAETERRLLQGTPVPGFKLVQGRRGARKWASSDVAEAMLIQVCGPDNAYERSLISPVTAEKMLKKTPHWAEIAALVVQAEGKPSVAPESDKRDAITSITADDFDVVN